MAEDIKQNTTCIACGSNDLVSALNLGDQPLANSYTSANETLPTYPLHVVRCQECCHLQLTHTVPPEEIYTDYPYRAGTNKTIVEYSDWFAKYVVQQVSMLPDVLDVGCNDGTQLNSFKELGCVTYGIDPAENLYRFSSANHDISLGFFNEETVAKFNGVQFDVINNQNAFAHLEDPSAFLQLAKQHLAQDGRIYISTSQANMVLNNEFDTIYHEHISFYNIKSMKALVERNGLYLTDVIKTPIHGVSYVFEVSKSAYNSAAIDNAIAMEELAGLYNPSTYYEWAHNVEQIAEQFKHMVFGFKEVKKQNIIGYGAAAKGNTFLNYTGVKLDAVIDDSSLKQGKYLPGSGTPIFSLQEIEQYFNLEESVFVPLAWNFFDEIQNKLNTHLGHKATFIRYFPKVELVK